MGLLRPWYPLLISSLFLVTSLPLAQSGDAEVLLALKSSIDPSNSLPWPQGSDFCQWPGIKECVRQRVTKLVVENFNLSGTLDEKSINQLDHLRVLSFKANSISGEIPNLSVLADLKLLFLNNNLFSGLFPSSITGLHRLKVIVLSGNRISGKIPSSLLKLRRLYILHLQDNRFTGEIPPLNQTSLRFFNVSNNQLSGKIPITPALIGFNSSSFSNNLNLCGDQIGNHYSNHDLPPISPTSQITVPSASSLKHNRRTKLIKIIAGTIGGFLLLLICLCLLWVACESCRRRKSGEVGSKEVGIEGGVTVRGEGRGEYSGAAPRGRDGNNGGKQGGFSWEEEGVGSLVFLGAADQQMTYTLEDLLKASAETLGRGTVGSTYKTVMESGFIVTVKRLKDAKYPIMEEFRQQMDVLGRLRHPNLVPLRAYFQANDERLLVYDYFPNGSLFSLIHGSRASSGGKPLHWTSCLKIAENLAAGLVYVHQIPGMIHGNLKSSNVLLGPDFESCITDYGLMSFRDPDSVEEPSSSSLFYRAHECRGASKSLTQQSDVYSFGVLLLELLTGKSPFQDLVQEHGVDIPQWIRSIREGETESGDDPASGNETSEEKLRAILNIAMACVSIDPESRPTMTEVLRLIRDGRAGNQVSSNSSDHSPGRWSDTIQSLPREEHLSI
ncbi:hypothetical protein NE237_021096 [Protea cynaroides]|uniref:Protein kinase domain-containing protein n=1 Tax=Protea cynaroides TaxID=273540 RepID=A0A9Q0K2Y9_9MAGN|nr:hypothetical protein NE237_021096 [Protea cynaroides]